MLAFLKYYNILLTSQELQLQVAQPRVSFAKPKGQTLVHVKGGQKGAASVDGALVGGVAVPAAVVVDVITPGFVGCLVLKITSRVNIGGGGASPKN